eukprot:4587518-Karenia_brevis.AAC.1
MLDDDIAKAKELPQTYLVVVGGDFNFGRAEDLVFKLDGQPDTSAARKTKLIGDFARIQKVLDKMVEISCKQPTHYDHS